MASRGITDRVAIVGAGCTRFGERRDAGADDLLIDAATEAAEAAGVELADIDAFWLGTFGSGHAGVALSKPLKLDNKPVTRVENFCATGSDAFRNACYAVAAGAYDVVMAIGVEKMMDSGQSGIPFFEFFGDGTAVPHTPPGTFGYLADGYAARYGVADEDLRAAMTHVAWKNHANGALNPRAYFQREIPKEVIDRQPPLAGRLSLLDCGGLADGAAAVVITRAEDAARYPGTPVLVKALALAAGPGTGNMDPAHDFASFPEAVAAARDAYRQAGVTDPRAQFALAEVHDCFTITEIVLMEDLGFAAPGTAWKDMVNGVFDRDGELPVNPDGGLKAFGHPLGASGLRMIFESWLQLRGEAGERQVDNGRTLALTQNVGGDPGECVSLVTILGTESG
ncbi:acetyl-CoA acetyltransferase [Spirillospora sp. NBC_00431]